MKKSALFLATISVVVISMITTFNSVNAMASVKYDYTKTTITLTETVEFSAEVSSISNITWYCDDVAVKSEWATSSNYTFIPKALGIYFIKLSVDGFTNPPPMGPTKVTVIAEPIPSPAPTQFPKPSPTATIAGVPTPHTTYNPGDPYTKVYLPTEVPPPNGTEPPVAKIISPADRQVFSSNNLTLVFNLTLQASTSFYPVTLGSLCYKPSWQPGNITVEIDSHAPFMKKTLPFAISLTSVPEGNQSITVYACEVCEWETSREFARVPNTPNSIIVGNFLYIDSNFYIMAGSSSVNFTIGTSSPIIPPEDDSDTDSAGTILLALGTTAIVAILVLVCLRWKHRK